MHKDAVVYVAGSTGLVGSALVRELRSQGYKNLVLKRIDLTNSNETYDFFEEEKPEYVFVAAAKVGGIHANNTYPSDFIEVNLKISSNVISAARQFGATKLLYLGSSCIYPRDADQPIREESLLAGPLEPTNAPYAIAKIAGISLCQSSNRQHKTNFIAAMPTNLYGPGDNFDLQSSHVLPALMRKIHEAKTEHKPEVEVWGSGDPIREFLHVDDCAKALVTMMQEFEPKDLCYLNVGCGYGISISELATLLKEAVGYTGKLKFNPAMPDGTPKKVLNIDRLCGLGWSPTISLSEGLAKTYEWFRRSKWTNLSNLR